MNRTLLFLSFLLSLSVFAQDERDVISGLVKDAVKPISNAHVVNLTSQRGSLSDRQGNFQISVKENDTLQISDIQFKTRRIIITRKHLLKGKIYVRMFQKNNELDEIIIESTNMAKAIGLPNADKKPMKPIERKIHYINSGGTIDKIYSWISGEKKRLKILQKRLAEDDLELSNRIDAQMIREHFGDDFFTDTLELPKEDIDEFLIYCTRYGIGRLFEQDRYMEIMDVLIKRKELFLQSRQK